MKKLLLIALLIVGCENTTDSVDNALEGEWIFIEREYTSFNNEGEMITEDISTTNGSWIFNQDNTFSGWNETSYDNISYSGIWSVSSNQLTLTLIQGEESQSLSYNYSISSNILSLTRTKIDDTGFCSCK
jgi:hypothetical protein